MKQAKEATVLRPPWVHLARVFWILLSAACITLFFIGTVNIMHKSLPSCAAPNASCGAGELSQEDVQVANEMGLPVSFTGFSLFFSVLARLSLAIVGILIFWRRSDDWVAMLISGALMTVLLEGIGNAGALDLAVALLLGIGTLLFVPIPFVFPNGRFEPRWLGWIVVPLTIAYAVASFGFSLANRLAALFALLNIVWVLLSIYAMAHRYFKVSSATERQQTKWIVLGLFVVLLNSIVYSVLISVFPITRPSPERIAALLINMPLYLIGYVFFAFSFFVAILRYRLWDIDVLIRKTLVYAALTALLALVYFGGVTVFGSLLSAISGQQSAIGIVISTLAIAALFSPLRRRVQEFIDRRFYRRKYNAERVLEEFASVARDEVEMHSLTNSLLEAVEETIQPEKINLWVRK
jgi:hypothetical protein